MPPDVGVFGGGARRSGVLAGDEVAGGYHVGLQCMSTVAVVRRETGGWKWPILQFAYMGVLAYAGAFLAFHAIG